MKKILGLLLAAIILSPSWGMADTKVTDMTAETAPAAADIMYLIKSPGGAGTDRKVTVGNLHATPGPIGSTTPSTGAFTTLTASSIIDGLTHIESANGKTINKLSAYYIASGTNNFVLPTPSAAGGNQYCFKQANNATNVITIIPVHTSGVMIENQAHTGYCTADDKLVSGGGKTDQVCLVALDATHYEMFSAVGTWTCTAH